MNANIVSGDPNLEEGIDVERGAPFGQLEDFSSLGFKGDFDARGETLGGTIDGDLSIGVNVDFMSAKEGFDGQLVTDFLGEDSIGRVGTAVTRSQCPT